MAIGYPRAYTSWYDAPLNTTKMIYNYHIPQITQALTTEMSIRGLGIPGWYGVTTGTLVSSSIYWQIRNAIDQCRNWDRSYRYEIVGYETIWVEELVYKGEVAVWATRMVDYYPKHQDANGVCTARQGPLWQNMSWGPVGWYGCSMRPNPNTLMGSEGCNLWLSGMKTDGFCQYQESESYISGYRSNYQMERVPKQGPAIWGIRYYNSGQPPFTWPDSYGYNLITGLDTNTARGHLNTLQSRCLCNCAYG